MLLIRTNNMDYINETVFSLIRYSDGSYRLAILTVQNASLFRETSLTSLVYKRWSELKTSIETKYNVLSIYTRVSVNVVLFSKDWLIISYNYLFWSDAKNFQRINVNSRHFSLSVWCYRYKIVQIIILYRALGAFISKGIRNRRWKRKELQIYRCWNSDSCGMYLLQRVYVTGLTSV